MKLKINRVILFAKDPIKLGEFYHLNFGLKYIGDPENKFWVELDGGSISIGLHAGGKPRTGRSNKIVFFSKNVTKARKELLELGLKMGAIKTFGRVQFCDGKDPEGNVFQISSR